MRVLGALITALLMAWAIYLASPYFALLDIAQAVAARDVPRLAARINIYAVRTSLVKSLLADGLAGTDLARFAPGGVGLTPGTVSVVLAPAVAEVVTPPAAADLIADGVSGGRAGSGARMAVPSLASILAASRWRGFRNVYLSLPVDAAANRQVRLQLRFSRLSWRLVSVDLPPAWRTRLIERIAAARSLAGTAAP